MLFIDLPTIYRGDIAISEFFEAILEKELRNRRSGQLRLFS